MNLARRTPHRLDVVSESRPADDGNGDITNLPTSIPGSDLFPQSETNQVVDPMTSPLQIDLDLPSIATKTELAPPT